MKVGDLVQVTEPRACGGRPMGALGLVLEKIRLTPPVKGCVTPAYKWRIEWWSDTAISEGRGMEVISESR